GERGGAGTEPGPQSGVGVFDPTPAVLGVQDVSLGDVVAGAGDVGHVPAGDQQGVRGKLRPLAGTRVRAGSWRTRAVAGAAEARDQPAPRAFGLAHRSMANDRSAPMKRVH